MRLLAAFLLSLAFALAMAQAPPPVNVPPDAPAAGPVLDSRTPEQVDSQTAELLARNVDARRAELTASPTALYKVVSEVFLPVFDTDYAGRLVLGKNWRTASASQRRQFIAAFYDFCSTAIPAMYFAFKKIGSGYCPEPGAPLIPSGRWSKLKCAWKTAPSCQFSTLCIRPRPAGGPSICALKAFPTCRTTAISSTRRSGPKGSTR